jgi:hypothetical protein
MPALFSQGEGCPLVNSKTSHIKSQIRFTFKTGKEFIASPLKINSDSSFSSVGVNKDSFFPKQVVCEVLNLMKRQSSSDVV